MQLKIAEIKYGHIYILMPNSRIAAQQYIITQIKHDAENMKQHWMSETEET